MRRLTSVLDAIGNTPLVPLTRIVAGTPARLLVKVEALNVTGSHKARAARAMVAAAERDGRLRRGSNQTIVAPTGGNLGVAIATIAIRHGYRFVAVVPDNYSRRKVALLRAYGAEVVLADSRRGNDAHGVLATELAIENADWVLLDQFSDPANPAGYEMSLAPEILADLGDERLDYLVAGIGSGAHLTGVGRALRAHWPQLAVIGVQPEGCDLLEERFVTHRIQGLAASSSVPPILDTSLITAMESIAESEAVETLFRTVRTEGVSLGLSSAANIGVCIRIAERLSEPATLLTFVYDGVTDYLDEVVEPKGARAG